MLTLPASFISLDSDYWRSLCRHHLFIYIIYIHHIFIYIGRMMVIFLPPVCQERFVWWIVRCTVWLLASWFHSIVLCMFIFTIIGACNDCLADLFQLRSTESFRFWKISAVSSQFLCPLQYLSISVSLFLEFLGSWKWSGCSSSFRICSLYCTASIFLLLLPQVWWFSRALREKRVFEF